MVGTASPAQLLHWHAGFGFFKNSMICCSLNRYFFTSVSLQKTDSTNFLVVASKGSSPSYYG